MGGGDFLYCIKSPFEPYLWVLMPGFGPSGPGRYGPEKDGYQ